MTGVRTDYHLEIKVAQEEVAEEEEVEVATLMIEVQEEDSLTRVGIGQTESRIGDGEQGAVKD